MYIYIYICIYAYTYEGARALLGDLRARRLRPNPPILDASEMLWSEKEGLPGCRGFWLVCLSYSRPTSLCKQGGATLI